MIKNLYTQDEINSIMETVNKVKGWDFSSLNDELQETPFDYLDTVRRYLGPEHTVLDIGTGGGEKFISLSDIYNHGTGIDIDPEMIKIAKKNAKNVKNVEFFEDSHKLKKVNKKFDVILNRHAPYNLNVIADHLFSGGYFITQRVGKNNMKNIEKIIGKTKNLSDYDYNQDLDDKLKKIAHMEYDVDYIVRDIKSILMWFKALDGAHANIDCGSALKDVKVLNKILEGNLDKRGFITNEHRILFILQKI
jgi:SAM-dependent methyltransferase